MSSPYVVMTIDSTLRMTARAFRASVDQKFLHPGTPALKALSSAYKTVNVSGIGEAAITQTGSLALPPSSGLLSSSVSFVKDGVLVQIGIYGRAAGSDQAHETQALAPIEAAAQRIAAAL